MNKIEEDNRNHLINIIEKIPYGIPDGWDKVIEITVGGLRCHTKAGDMVEMVAPEYPRQKIVFMSDYKLYIQNPKESFILFDDYEIRGYEFSKCGRECHGKPERNRDRNYR